MARCRGRYRSRDQHRHLRSHRSTRGDRTLGDHHYLTVARWRARYAPSTATPGY